MRSERFELLVFSLAVVVVTFTLRLCLGEDSSDPQHLNRKAISLAQHGELRGALELFRELSKIEPENSEYWNNAGVTLMRMKLYHLAEVHFRQALQLDENEDARDNVSLVTPSTYKPRARMKSHFFFVQDERS